MPKEYQEILDSIEEQKELITKTQDQMGKYTAFMRKAAKTMVDKQPFQNLEATKTASVLEKAADALELFWDPNAPTYLMDSNYSKEYVDALFKLSEIFSSRNGNYAIWNAIGLTPSEGEFDKIQMMEDMSVVSKVLGFSILTKESFNQYSKSFNVSEKKFLSSDKSKKKSIDDDFVIIDMDEEKNAVERAPKKYKSQFVLKEKPKVEERKAEEPKKEEPAPQVEEPQKEEPQKAEPAPQVEAPKVEYPNVGYPTFDDAPIELPEELQKYADRIHNQKVEEPTNKVYNINAIDDEPEEMQEEPKTEEIKKEEPKKEEIKKEEPKKEESKKKDAPKPKNDYEKALNKKDENIAAEYERNREGVHNVATRFGDGNIQLNYLDPVHGRSVAGQYFTSFDQLHTMIILGKMAAKGKHGWEYPMSHNDAKEYLKITGENNDYNEIHASMTPDDVKKVSNDPMEMVAICQDYEKNHGLGRNERIMADDRQMVKALEQMKKEIIGGKTNGASESTDKMVEKIQDTINYLSRPANARFNMDVREKKLEQLGLAAQEYIDHKKSEVKDQKKVNKPGWEPSSGIGKIRYRHANTLIGFVKNCGVNMDKAKEEPNFAQPRKVKVNTDHYDWIDHMESLAPGGNIVKEEHARVMVEAVAGMLAASLVENMKQADRTKYLYNKKEFEMLQKDVYASKAFKSISKDACAGIIKGNYKELFKLKDKAMLNGGKSLIEKFNKEIVKNKEKLPGTEKMFQAKTASKGMKK